MCCTHTLRFFKTHIHAVLLVCLCTRVLVVATVAHTLQNVQRFHQRSPLPRRIALLRGKEGCFHLHFTCMINMAFTNEALYLDA
jgi:hypothetical protein